MELIVNVAGGPWPRADGVIYDAFPDSVPITKAYQWTSLVNDPPPVVPVKSVIEKIDATAGRTFPLTNPNETDPIGGDKLGMFHWDYEPRNGFGNRWDLFRREYNATLCNQWLQITLAAVRHLKEGPGKDWEVALWGMPLLPSSSGDVPSMKDLGAGGSDEDYGRVISHLTPLWQTMDFCLVGHYLRDTHLRSGPMAVYQWTRESLELMQQLYGYKCIPALWGHYSRGSGRNGQFLDYMDLLLQLYALKLGGAERIWQWFGITSQAAAESEAKWVKSVFVPAWNVVFGADDGLDLSEPMHSQDEDLVGTIDQDQADFAPGGQFNNPPANAGPSLS